MSTICTLTDEQFAELAPKVDANQKAMRHLPNGMPSAEFRAALPFPDVGNDEAGKVEQFRLRLTKPNKFGAYLNSDGTAVTTWTGDILGYVIGIPRRSRDNRVTTFRFRMVGQEYSCRGSGYGMYCGCKAIKPRESNMRAYVTRDGEILTQYPIMTSDTLEADFYARKYANEEHGRTVEDCCDKPRTYVPCGGDFTVTVAQKRYGAFGAVCWQSRNYFFDEAR